jgi:hypothetical protein
MVELVPVDHDPFDGIALVPVDHNPFDALYPTSSPGAEERTPDTTRDHLDVERSDSEQAARWLGTTENPDARVPTVTLVGNDGAPRNNQAQNRQFRAVVKILQLTPGQAQQLHREISGQGLGFHEILQIGREMFGK